ncbi:shikimate dehydrogenase [Deltaproteobacteria bacterium Smac51]|nr:shikimate dehydrogenase [Deltaproteobacteria bacterium Smac51]
MYTPPVDKLYGIIGYPVSHSLSPMLHTTAFQMLNIPAVLLPWAIEPEKLPAFMESFRLLKIQGCCVTIPHKEAVIPFLDEVSERARAIGAVNLLYLRDGNVCGDNTDVLGFMEPLRGALTPDAPCRALVLGAGGACRAVVAGLRELGLTDITVAYVSKKMPADFSAAFDFKQVPWSDRLDVPADLVINVTPLGMKGQHVNETPYPSEMFSGRSGLAYDTVYTPLETRFLREAVQAGWRTIGGLAMFLGQAEAQFLTWTGHRLTSEARRKVEDELADCCGNNRGRGPERRPEPF